MTPQRKEWRNEEPWVSIEGILWDIKGGQLTDIEICMSEIKAHLDRWPKEEEKHKEGLVNWFSRANNEAGNAGSSGRPAKPENKCPLRVHPYGRKDDIPLCPEPFCMHTLLPGEKICPCHTPPQENHISQSAKMVAPDLKIDWDGKTLLPGFPELRVANLVRRAHSSKDCPHKGNCLTEAEMIHEVGLILRQLLSQKESQVLSKVKEAKEEIENLKTILWSDDSAQHIRNIQNYQTINKVLDILNKIEQ